MDKQITLTVVTPSGVEISRRVDLVVAPGVEGDLGVLPGHLPLMTRLRAGVLRFYAENEQQVLAVSEGYMEVTPDKVIILAEAAEMPGEIDVRRALEAKRRAEERLAAGGVSAGEMAKAQASLQRALLRLRVASRYSPNGTADKSPD